LGAKDAEKPAIDALVMIEIFQAPTGHSSEARDIHDVLDIGQWEPVK